MATFLVTRKKSAAYAAICFLLYFFDVALVFQNDFLNNNLTVSLSMVYTINNPFVAIITGCGILTAFWFMICKYIYEERLIVRIAPPILFVLLSVAIYELMPTSGFKQFAFYSMRELFLAGILIYLALRYLSESNDFIRAIMRKQWKFYVLLWVGCIAIVLENIFFQISLDLALEGQTLPFLPERNFAENFLVLASAAFIFKNSYEIFKLHYKAPPTHSDEPLQEYIYTKLDAYSIHYNLSAREGEVLSLLLQGKDNQNIASELNISLATAKVHVHNILKKTRLGNRQEVIQDFWSMN